jgi:hypothetical protein
MTDRIALVLALIIAAAVAFDFWQNDAQVLMFLARKMLALVDYVIFWR